MANLGAIPLGDFDFGVIVYDSNDLAAALSEFCIIGSKKGIVSIDDLNIISTDMPEPAVFKTVKEGLSQGNKLFDMIMYFSVPEDQRPKARSPRGNETGDPIPDIDIARAVFYLAFFLLTRANVPSGDDDSVGSGVPRFLSNIMGLNGTPASYASKLASFKLEKMEHSWIRHIKWKQLGSEALNRIGLGVAGYRMASPFVLLSPRENLAAQQQVSLTVAQSIAREPADWSIHPVTRDPAILKKYGNLNANLGNLMLECFEAADLQRLVEVKVLFAIPTANIRHTQFRTWTADMVFKSSDPIFVN